MAKCSRYVGGSGGKWIARELSSPLLSQVGFAVVEVKVQVVLRVGPLSNDSLSCCILLYW